MKALRETVENEQFVISPRSYDHVKAFFLSLHNSTDYEKKLQGLSPETGKREFLTCVDPAGKVMGVAEELVADFRDTLRRYPAFARWFREAPMELEPEKKTLLVARWLCHVAGFRHRSVHLFIDHPTNCDLTFVQIRSFEKAESPGCFDLAAAGHVVDLQEPREALYQELREELGLEPTDLVSLPEEIESKGYEYREPMGDRWYRNVEYRFVFKAILKKNAFSTIKFKDREVAGICLFSLAALESMLQKYPEKIASGLGESFSHYQKEKLISSADRQSSLLKTVSPARTVCST